MQLVNKCVRLWALPGQTAFYMKTKGKNIMKTIVPYSINSLGTLERTCIMGCFQVRIIGQPNVKFSV